MQIEARAYHALACHYHGDYRRLRKLYAQHRSWHAAWQTTHLASEKETAAAWARLEALHIQLILADDPLFPPLLREIPWPPHAVYLRGAPVGSEPHIAIVGTRKPTPSGLSTAAELAGACARAGCTIVSGLAFGIDAASHRSALAQHAKTIAVLGSGLDVISPRSHTQLGKQILESGGSLIAEYPPGTAALPRFFLERNRIVSGLSRGVIVVESPTRSGTLATARFAIEQNREVFVVPGAMMNPNYAGSHALIRSGATLITSADDVLSALDIITEKPAAARQAKVLPFLDEPQTRIVELLTGADRPLSIAAIAERTQLGTTVISEALTLLAIEQLVQEEGGVYYI